MEKEVHKLHVARVAHGFIWFAERRVTWPDNMGYIPSMRARIAYDIETLKSRELLSVPSRFKTPEDAHRELVNEEREHHWFLQWDPITDGVSVLLFRQNDEITLTCEWCRPNSSERDRESIRSSTFKTDALVELLERLLVELE